MHGQWADGRRSVATAAAPNICVAMCHPCPVRVDLDARQQEAVDHGAGPCLVLAGPGSGKTRVIVERFLRLIDAGVPADRQLVLTYTRKAAEEMRTRAEARLGPFAADSPLSNYHSFAQRLLRQHAWRLGISPHFRIADAAERWLEVDAILGELRPLTLHNPLRPHDLVDSILGLIGQAKTELVSPQRYEEWAQQRLEGCDDEAERFLLRRHVECAAVYARLDDRYKRRGILDHDDTILVAQRLLEEDAAVRAAVRDGIDMVMVDEYQDTNFAQARLVETLVEAHGNLLVVADDDQSIYKFRGASLANLDRFQRLYPEHHKVILDCNYRSSTEIVGASRAIITAAQPESRIEKHLVAARGAGEKVEIWRAEDERGEVTAIAAECRRLIDCGMAPSDIAWLFRRHDDMQAAIRALTEAGVPHRVHGGRGFFQRREIKDLLALLHGAADPDDSQSLLRCLNLPHFAVSNEGRLRLSRAAHEHDLPLIAVITSGAANLGGEDDVAARRLVDTIVELHAQVAREDVRDLFYTALEMTEFLGMLDGLQPHEAEQIGANLNKFGEMLDAFADWSDDRSLGVALRYLDILRNSHSADEMASVETRVDGVSLLTAHSAKGLEWPVVILSRCVEERWPGRPGPGSRLALPDDLVPEPAPAGDGHRDEERRLFYVAATRARDRLLLTSARRYAHSWQDEKITPFLDPLLELDGVAPLKALPRGEAPQPARPAELLGIPPARVRASVSDLAAFKDCPRRYAYRSVYRVPVPASVQRWYGVLIHSVLQTAAMQAMSGVTVDADGAAALWNEAWRTARGPKGAHPELHALGEEQLRRYVASPGWERARILGVEEGFVLEVDAADVSGRFDRIDDGDTGPVVIDYKTGPPRTEEELKRDLQVRGYAAAMARKHRSDEIAVELHWLQTSEVTRVEFDRALLGKAKGQIEGVAGELAVAVQLREFPAKPNAWKCKRCDFRTVCDEGRPDGAQNA
jgi:DNA helicase-2/ATP-dependent DNA helicase PcrA